VIVCVAGWREGYFLGFVLAFYAACHCFALDVLEAVQRFLQLLGLYGDGNTCLAENSLSSVRISPLSSR
jgi:hypothetical protein